MEVRRSSRKRKPRVEDPLSDTDESPRKAPKFPPAGPLVGGKPLKLSQILELLERSRNALVAIPPGDKTNVYFVVQNTVSPWRIHKGGFNAFPDDSGMWDRNKSTKVFQYIGKFNGSWKALVLVDNLFYEKTESRPRLNPQPDMDSVVKAHHFYAYHACDVDFKRRITLLSGNGFKEDRALVEYTGKLKIKFTVPMPVVEEYYPPVQRRGIGAESVPEPVVAKQNNLNDSIKRRRSTGKERVYEPEVAQQNNLKDSLKRSTGKERVREPELAQQNKLNKSASKMSTVKQIMLSMLAESPGVQAIIGRRGEPQCVILFSDDQLSDMKRNLECENLIGVDCTHKLGDCYLTMTVYQNAQALHKSTNEPLLVLGPVYLHWDTEFLTYVAFFSYIMEKLDGMEPNIEVRLGDDMGLSLFQALKFSFPSSSYILESRQLRNVVNSGVLDACEGRVKECSAIIKQIFGLDGLTSSPSMFVFVERVSELAPYFKEYPKLRKYFVELKVLLYEYYIEPLQNGMYPKLWSCYRDEVLESHVQAFLPKKSCDLPMLVRKLTSVSSLLMQYIDDKCK